MNGSAVSSRLVFLGCACLAAGLAARGSGAAQMPPASPAAEDRTARFRERSERSEREGLAEPFKGITTDGEGRARPLHRPLHGRLHGARAEGGRGLPGRAHPRAARTDARSRWTIPNGASG